MFGQWRKPGHSGAQCRAETAPHAELPRGLAPTLGEGQPGSQIAMRWGAPLARGPAPAIPFTVALSTARVLRLNLD